MRYLFTYCFLVLSVLLFSQQNWKKISIDEYIKIVKPVQEKMKNTESYSVQVSYASYKGHGATAVYDRQDGYVLKEKKKIHSFLVGIHMIQDERGRVAIDTAQKIITVNDPASEASQYPALDTTGMRSYIQTIKYAETGGVQYMRIEFKPGYPFEATELKMKDRWISQVTMLYAVSVSKTSEEPKVKPKVVITYSDLKLKPHFGDGIFDADRYVHYQHNKKINLDPQYGNYKLYDQRVKIFLNK